MIRNSIVSKLWLTIAGLVVVVLGLLSMYLEQMIDTYLYQVQAQAFQNRADYIAATLRTGSPEASVVAENLARQAGASLYVLGTPGQDPTAEAVWSRLTVDERSKLLAGDDVIPRADRLCRTFRSFAATQTICGSWFPWPVREMRFD